MFFKKKKIILNCYTYNQQTYDFFPISKSTKHLPSWWKQMGPTFNTPARFTGWPTIKSCHSVNAFLKRGVTIPLWTDALLGVAKVDTPAGPQHRIITEFGDQVQTKCGVHGSMQMSQEFLPEHNYTHLKLETPWLFESDDDTEWLWTHPVYNNNELDQFTTLPGIIEFKYNHVVNINLTMRKEWNGEPLLLNLEAGKPMVNLIPMSNRQVEVRNHLVSKDEWNEIKDRNTHIFFRGNYNKFVKLNKEKETKCPFGFGK